MGEELAAIARGEGQFRSDGHRAMEVAKLEKRLLREQRSAAAYYSHAWNEETDLMREQRNEIERIRNRIPDLERNRKRLEEDLATESRRVKDHSPDRLTREKATIQQMAEELEGAGYGADILRADGPSAFAAIEVMSQNGLLGFRGPIVNSLESQPMRILFLAANPVATSHLDLEEELRSLESELRGVKYRVLDTVSQSGPTRDRRIQEMK
jgi:hypothetical protein